MKNNKNKKKVYKSKTRNQEVELVSLFESSKHNEQDKKKLNILKICIRSISAFMSQDHSTIVNELYFNGRYNVVDDSITKMKGIVSLTEKTMKRYRDKYCQVAEAVLPMLDDIEL